MTIASTTIYEETIEGVNAAVYADLTFSSTYVTGGEALTAEQFGLQRIKSVEADVTSLTTTALTAVYNRSTGKLILVAPAGTQVANGTALSAVTVSLKVVGA